VKATGWLRGLEVTVGGTGIVSHAGLALLRALADGPGLTAALSKALASDRVLVHDRGRVLADLACAIADGAGVISDFRVMGDQHELFGLVASVPTCWRALNETAAGGGAALARISGAVNAATLLAWLRLLALDGHLAKAEPKTLRYRILHTAARLARSGRRRRLKIAASWPWAPAIVTAWDRITALPQAP